MIHEFDWPGNLFAVTYAWRQLRWLAALQTDHMKEEEDLQTDHMKEEEQQARTRARTPTPQRCVDTPNIRPPIATQEDSVPSWTIRLYEAMRMPLIPNPSPQPTVSLTPHLSP